MKHDNPGFDTLAVRGGQQRTSESENSEAIFASSSFVFENAAQAAARFAGDEKGNIYSRFTNPTVSAFERRLAALDFFALRDTLKLTCGATSKSSSYI